VGSGPIVLFLPARNEAAAIGGVIARVPACVRGRPVRCLVIDDGSTDGTAGIARAAGAGVVAMDRASGLGAAVRRGLHEAVARGAAVVAFCDADGEYAPDELERMVAPLLDGDADYVVGSRFRGHIARMLPHRRLGNSLLTVLLRWVARTRISDGQSGYRALTGEAAAAACIAHDYNYAQVLTLDLLAKGFRYAEVPISYTFRETGRSFVKPIRYLREVVPTVVRVVRDANRGASAERPRRRAVGAAAAAIAVGCAVVALLSLGGRAQVPLEGAGPLVFLSAFALAGAAMIALAWPWCDVMTSLGATTRRSDALALYFAGEIGKYVPGAVWPVVGRAERARGVGVATEVAYASVAMSLGFAYLAAGIALAAILPLAVLTAGVAGTLALAVLVVPVALVALHPQVVGRFVHAIERVTRRPLALDTPPWSRSTTLALRYLPAWAFVAATTVMVATALGNHGDVAVVAAAAIGSWIIGFVVVPVPGGIGVREVVFASTSGLPFDDALVVAFTTRLLFVTVDLVGYVIGSRMLRRRARSRSVVDDVSSEALARLEPFVLVEPGVPERSGSSPSHRERVVGVVVGEQSLPTERHHPGH
jgi:uncharacterized membrane protein YbhN (UPF0104 family)